MADFLELLRAQRETAERMSAEVSRMLGDPEITTHQVKKLFAALEEQANFAERLTGVLEDRGFDFDIIRAAEALEDFYAEMAAAVAEKLATRGG